jgi:hypothetical protein
MSATFNWVISQVERDLLPAEMNGAITVSHWRCTASQTVGTGDDAVDYTAASYGTAGFQADPSAAGYISYGDVTEQNVLDWTWLKIDKDAIESGLQANVDGQITPTKASGTPWA